MYDARQLNNVLPDQFINSPTQGFMRSSKLEQKVCCLFLELEFYFETPSKKTFLDKPLKKK